jgi:hypothetical protein
LFTAPSESTSAPSSSAREVAATASGAPFCSAWSARPKTARRRARAEAEVRLDQIADAVETPYERLADAEGAADGRRLRREDAGRRAV